MFTTVGLVCLRVLLCSIRWFECLGWVDVFAVCLGFSCLLACCGCGLACWIIVLFEFDCYMCISFGWLFTCLTCRCCFIGFSGVLVVVEWFVVYCLFGAGVFFSCID